MSSHDQFPLEPVAPTIEYIRTPEDDDQLVRYLDQNWLPRKRQIARRQMMFVVWVSIVAFSWFLFFGSITFFIFISPVFAFAMLIPRIWRKRFIRRQHQAGAYNRLRRVQITPRGLQVSTSATELLIRWQAISHVTRQGAWLYITVRDQEIFNIPLGALTPEQARAFEALAQRHARLALGHDPDVA